jgi:O-antigen/teichoic acid export membrane protein
VPGVGQIVARNSLFGIAGQVALKLLSFVFTIAVVRQLGDHEFGRYATALAFVGIFAVFADGGMAGYAVREIAKDRGQAARLFGDMVALRLLLSALVLLSNTGLALLLGYDRGLVLLIALASGGLLLYAIQGPLQVVLQGFERIDYAASFTVLNQTIFIAAGALLLWSGGGAGGVILASFCGVAATAALSWRAARRLSELPLRVDPRRWLPLLRAGLPFGIITFATMLSFKVDTVLLSLWRAPAEVGWYNVAYNLIFTFLILSSGFNSALVPSLSRHYQREAAAVGRFYLRSMRILWTVALPLAVGGSLLAERLILLLYGAEYAPAGAALRILIWVLPALTITSLCGAITTVLHRERSTARINLVNAALNISLNLWAIPRYGLLGAAIVTVVTELLGLGQYLLLLRDAFPIGRIGRDLAAPTAAALLLGGALLLLQSLPLGLVIALGGLSYGGLLLLTGGLSIGEIRAIRTTISALLSRQVPATEQAQ